MSRGAERAAGVVCGGGVGMERVPATGQVGVIESDAAAARYARFLRRKGRAVSGMGNTEDPQVPSPCCPTLGALSPVLCCQLHSPLLLTGCHHIAGAWPRFYSKL